MSQSPYDDEFRAIRYIQLRGQDIANAHETINSDIESLKAQLTGLISGTELDEAEHLALKEHHLREMTPSDTAMHSTGLKTIYSEANQRVCGDIGLATILSTDDLAVVDARIQNHIKEFNDRYALDARLCYCLRMRAHSIHAGFTLRQSPAKTYGELYGRSGWYFQ